MSLDEQIRYILRHRCRIPVMPKIGFAKQSPELIEAPAVIDVGQMLDTILYRSETLEKENSALREDLLWIIKNSGQLEWIRDVKREFLKKYFPEQIKTLPYCMGGDFIDSKGDSGK